MIGSGASQDNSDEIWDEDRHQHRPRHAGRVRAMGGASRSEQGERVEVWEGGRLIGYQYIRPDRRGCKLPLHG